MAPDPDPPNPPDPPVLDYADPALGRIIVIARFRDESQAHMAAARLEGDDIDVAVTDVMPGRALGARAATLGVPSDQVQRAVAILKTTPARPFLLDEHR